MNGANGHYGQPNPWQEHKTADGRAYYYNTTTKATQWTKPEDMMTPAEVCSTNPDPVAVARLSGLQC